MNPEKEHHYIVGLKQGNHQAIEGIYTQYAQQIRGLVEKNSGSAEDAKDVFQEGLIAIYDLVTQKNFQLTCPFGALLYRICRNKWIDKIREKNKRQEVSLSDDLRYTAEASEDILTLAEEANEQNQINDRRQKAFLQLSDLCQQLLNLVKKGTTAKNIVAQLEMSNINTYYRRKNACMERWRKLGQ